MLYCIETNGTVRSTVKLIEDNVGIDTSIGYYSDGIVLLLRVGGTKFFVDQNGRIYYNASSEPRYDYNGRLEGFGYDERVYYEYGKIESIGGTYIFYNGDDGRIKCIGDSYFFYWTYGAENGKIKSFGDISYYYGSYGDEAGKPKSVGSYNIYYNYGKISSIAGKSVYYDYNGKINCIGNTRIY